MDGYYLSVCCDAPPLSIMEDGEGVMGMCSECKEWDEFYENEDNVDWSDEIEYIKNHLRD